MVSHPGVNYTIQFDTGFQSKIKLYVFPEVGYKIAE